jgi:hypothetical protein
MIRLAAIVRGAVHEQLVPKSLLHDKRRLCALLASSGVNIDPAGEQQLVGYLAAFLRANERVLPLLRARAGTGWDGDFATFMYGDECIGDRDDILDSFGDDEATRHLVSALRTEGDADRWRATAEDMIAAAPVAGLALACAISAPMVRLFQWTKIGIVLGAIGGAGKTSVARLGASAFGFTGLAGSDQPNGLIRVAHGTPKGLLLQFRRFPDLPHFMDELKPDLTDDRRQAEVADLLHQLHEGQEHVRATRSSTGVRTGDQFPGSTLVAGEVASGDFLRKGGVIRRFLSPGDPYVVADGVHLGRFNADLCANYGHLGRDLVEALVAADSETRWRLRRLHADHLEALGVPADADEFVRSWARQIATALAAVDVAAELVPDVCPTPGPCKDAIKAVWAQLEGKAGSGDTRDVLAIAERKIRSYIAQSRAHLHATPERRAGLGVYNHLDAAQSAELNPRAPVLGRVVKATNEGLADEQLLEVDIVQSQMSRFLAAEGYSAGTITGGLARRGFIKAGPKKGEVARTSRVGGTATSVYRIDLATGAPENDEGV